MFFSFFISEHAGAIARTKNSLEDAREALNNLPDTFYLYAGYCFLFIFISLYTAASYTQAYLFSLTRLKWQVLLHLASIRHVCVWISVLKRTRMNSSRVFNGQCNTSTLTRCSKALYRRDNIFLRLSLSRRSP